MISQDCYPTPPDAMDALTVVPCVRLHWTPLAPAALDARARFVMTAPYGLNQVNAARDPYAAIALWNRRYGRAVRLWEWHDSSRTVQRLYRRKLKRAERIFRQLGVPK